MRVLLERGHAVHCASWNHLLPELIVAGGGSSRAHLLDVSRLQHQQQRGSSSGSSGGGNVVTTYAEHGRAINDVQWNPNNPDEFATVSTDGLVKLWDRRTRGGSVNTLLDRGQAVDGHNSGSGNGSSSVSVSGDPVPLLCCDWHKAHDWLLAVGNTADQALVWDIRNTLQPLKRRSAHRGPVSCVKFDTCRPDRLATCSSGDRTVRVWDVSGDGIYLTHEHRVHRRGATHVDWDVHRDSVITSCGMDGAVICKPLDSITQVSEQYRAGRLVTTKTVPQRRIVSTAPRSRL